MREIKFRVWHQNEKEMYYIQKTEYLGQTAIIDNFVDHPKGVWQQYTGLKDKNGVEIYEGDVLSTDLDRPYLIVVYRNGAFMFDCSDGGKEYYDLMVPINEESDTLKYHEVIGNIYENPELLAEVN